MYKTVEVKEIAKSASFAPEAVYRHFMEITKKPHPSRIPEDPSHNEDPIRKYVVDCARKIPDVEVSFYEPGATETGRRVIVLRRKVSGRDNYVTLQAHMDMVCYPKNDIFPLNVFTYEDESITWMKAGENPGSIRDPSKGTTLGADDGIGVATALALLEDKDLSKYPIECLFTVQEETDMGGAKEFSRNLLKGRTYINLDAEDATTIFYGSAGGCSATFKGSLERSDRPQDFLLLKASISKLLGGHSGININKGRLNAIKAMTSALIRLNCRLTNMDIKGVGIGSYDLRLVSMKREEEAKMNSIPSSVSAIVAVPKDKYESFQKDFLNYCNALKLQFMPEESGFKCDMNIVPDETSDMKPLTERSTDNILCLLKQIPHGVISMIPSRPTLVETSTNLAKVELEAESATISSSNRSSSDKFMEDLTFTQTSIARNFNFDVTIGDRYPSWQPNEHSDLLKKTKEVYDAKYGRDSEATVIHAGLECSYIVKKYEDAEEPMDCIAIGPTILDPHGGAERLRVDTVESFYGAVKELIQKIFTQ